MTISTDEPASRRFDWEKIRARLADLERKSANPPALTGYASRQILKLRAAALAARAEAHAERETMEIVAFRMGEELYGLDPSFVREVCPLVRLTPIPSTPSFVLGIISIRGRIVSVIDLRKILDLPSADVTSQHKVVVIENDTMSFGILAESVEGIRRLAVREVGPALPTLTGVREKYVKGVTPDRTIVLDAAAILADETIVIDDEAD